MKRFSANLIVVLALALVAGCREAPNEPRPSAEAAHRSGFLAVSEPDAANRLSLAVVPPHGRSIAGLVGTIRFDPARYRFVGQPSPEPPFAIVNSTDASSGSVRVAALAVPTLASTAGVFVFEQINRPALDAIWFEPIEARRTDGGWVRTEEKWPVAAVTGPTIDLASARPLGIADWVAALAPASGTGPQLVPGAGSIYGDATLDGIVNIVDAYAAANLAVGNLPLIVDAGKDYVVAANVFPFNLPGLGEATDLTPPGVESNGSRIITILDAVAIANESVGNDQPIVRESIPGRAIATPRAVLTGTITVNRTLARDTVYELDGVVKVAGGVVLTVQAGTRIEGQPATRGTLMVLRGARLEADGTLLEPIVMTCAAPSPAPGCWGGLVINGLSLLNNDVSGPGTIVVCPEKQTIGSTELYGGCLVENNSGTLRYVRIEHAGQIWNGSPTPGLALLGVGSGTRIDNVQVHGSAGSGVFVSGGAIDLRRLLITGSSSHGLAWDDGWCGYGQFIVVQQPSSGGAGFYGSNYALNPNAGPRSIPELYHVTLIGAPTGAANQPGIRLVAGSGLRLRSSAVLGFTGPGFDVQEVATCALAGGSSLILEATYFHQNGEGFASDPDCLDEVAFGSAPARANVLADPQVIAPFNTVTLDARLAAGSPAASGAPTAPAVPFFDALASYFGAVEAATAQGNVVPWFTGWSRGWNGLVP